jgi:predicted amidophosphoribosyltransferase
MSKDKQQRQEEKAAKRQERLQRHIVQCPHCGKDVLDHMTECPHCKGKLEPLGYSTTDREKIGKIRRITYTIGIAAVVIVLIVVTILKNRG